MACIIHIIDPKHRMSIPLIVILSLLPDLLIRSYRRLFVLDMHFAVRRCRSNPGFHT